MLLYALVSSGQLVSGTVDLRQLALKAIMVPTVVSGDLTLQGNVDSSSGNFLRTLDFRGQGSGDLRFATGPGSRMILWPETIPTPPFARLETLGSPQTNPATFVLLTQPRR